MLYSTFCSQLLKMFKVYGDFSTTKLWLHLSCPIWIHFQFVTGQEMKRSVTQDTASSGWMQALHGAREEEEGSRCLFSSSRSCSGSICTLGWAVTGGSVQGRSGQVLVEGETCPCSPWEAAAVPEALQTSVPHSPRPCVFRHHRFGKVPFPPALLHCLRNS